MQLIQSWQFLVMFTFTCIGGGCGGGGGGGGGIQGSKIVHVRSYLRVEVR